ncbi:hypothetical protein [Paenibacillus sp. GCM10012303]|uniref:hypothetical protein n=1 Tax=Paenibacillus sp. GCM10012303 TaxID=3317340 RepID=UPI0036124A2F
MIDELSIAQADPSDKAEMPTKYCLVFLTSAEGMPYNNRQKRAEMKIQQETTEGTILVYENKRYLLPADIMKRIMTIMEPR